MEGIKIMLPPILSHIYESDHYATPSFYGVISGDELFCTSQIAIIFV